MRRRRPINRLQLGPIVGHTDDQSTRIWIRVYDDPSLYTLRIQGYGIFTFASTEKGVIEFGTAIALVEGLRHDWRYRYQVLRYGRVVPGSGGSFRTMPQPGSIAEMTFVAVSGNHQKDEGAWSQLDEFIKKAQPRFFLMLGDQVYVDQEGSEWGSAWEHHLDSQPDERRKFLADKYQENWSRQEVRRVMANIPTYMIWDDHEIRDGWGSLAPDSPTLAARYERGAPIYERYNAYYEDARDVYWHFQMCHNPPAYGFLQEPPPSGVRRAMPFFFRCGRTGVLVLDSRGDRDLWREDGPPILGSEQWQFIEQFSEELASDIDALVIATPVPIASMSPNGQTQSLIGYRTDDVELFKKGDDKGLQAMQKTKGAWYDYFSAAYASSIRFHYGVSLNRGSFHLCDIDDARDQWSNHFSRPEQEKLIRMAGSARLTNRIPSAPRGLIFVGGDLHAGALFNIKVSKPEFTVPCFVASGISQKTQADEPVIYTVVDENFEVSSGIYATMHELVDDYNFGVVQIIPTGATPVIIPTIAHSGNAFAWGININLPI